ncbi:MAG: alpha/beta hydrolase [Bacteroidota bacterium]
MQFNTKRIRNIAITIILLFVSAISNAQNSDKYRKKDLTDAALVKTLPGFENGYAEVNGVNIHYVAGGNGQPLVLLPGWPETWWSYHKIMPLLAEKYHVIVVDIRGMGSSGRPAEGYDKKTMAKDIYELIHRLGYQKVYMAGHDIGSQVAWSFAANYPDATSKLIILDVPHPDETWFSIPMLPALGTFSDKIDAAHPYVWWFAFHQVKELPEKMLAGRAGIEHEWFFKYLLYNEAAINSLDRAVYAAAYNSAGGIRSGNAWYQTFSQDIADEKKYKKLEMPVLGIGGPGFGWLQSVIPGKTVNSKVVQAEGSGHFIAEEKPEAAARFMIDFLQ